MKQRTLLLLTVVASFCCLSWGAGIAQEKKYRNFSISTGPEKMITDCGQVRMRVDDREVARSELERTLPRSAVASLQVRTTHHGGIQVNGWDRDHYSIKACLGAAGDDLAEAQKLLAQIALSVEGGRVSVEGPRDGAWMAYLIIHAPNGTALDLESKNGPIGVSAFSGTIEARNLNGPVTLYDVTGRVRADVVNGPINMTGSGGEHRLNVQNGPLNVELAGSRWESGELEGHTQNGPVNLTLPPDYQAAVRVDASKHSGVECRAVQCKEAVRTWDRPNRIEFGGATPVVRLSTVNGPVTITSPGAKR